MRDSANDVAAQSPESRPKKRARRKGTIVVLAAVFMVVMLGMVAFSVDVGYIAKVDAELKRACDAGALAGARALVNGNEAAVQAVHDYIALNPVAGHTVDPGQIQVELGHWDPDARAFNVTSQTPSTVRVTLANQGEPLFFGRVLNRNAFDTNAQAVAMHQPRDIVLTLDYSLSMCYDSQLRSLDSLGRYYIENNLQTMYSQLGKGPFGNLEFTPKFATIEGMTPTNSNMAQIHVRFESNRVHVSSTKDITQVRLRFSNGNTQTFSTSGTSGYYAGTGSNSTRRIDDVWVKSGTNDSNSPSGAGERFEDSTSDLIEAFGLTNVPYPYPGDSWGNYFNYVKNDSIINDAGYRKMYGYLTWMNYLQASRGSYSQTPDLWKTDEQPVTALKNATDVFFGFLQGAQSQDRVGVSLYTSSNNTAVLESELTPDFASLSTIIRQRQAGHYTSMTNIYDGMRTARLELINNGRTNAFKMQVLMTDGQANLPGSTSNARAKVIEEAQLSAAARIPIVCISLGAGADVPLMQEVADITGGVSFVVPGGQTIADMQEQLEAIFKQVADNKPLKIVQ